MIGTSEDNQVGWKLAGVAALVLACLAAMGFGRYAYPVILPDMQKGLGLSYAHMGTIGTANMAGYLVFALLGGALGDRYRPKIIIMISLLFLAGAMVLMGQVSNYYVALVLMFVAGMGTAGAYVLSQGVAASWFRPQQRGMVLGILASGVNWGTFFAAFLVPWAAALGGGGPDGWRDSWLAVGLLVLLSAIVVAVAVRERYRGSSVTEKPGPGQVASRAIWLQPAVIYAGIIYLMYGFFAIYMVFFVSYLRNDLMLSMSQVKSIWMFVGLLSGATGWLWGLLSDRIGRKKALVTGVGAACVGLILVLFSRSVGAMYLSTILWGLTFSAPMSIIPATATEIVDRSQINQALGLVTMAFGLGQAIGPALAGALIDITSSFMPAFGITLAALLVTIVCFLLLPVAGRKTGASVSPGQAGLQP